MSEIVYELTELRGDDVRVGNYIRPANFRFPNFCDGCPLAEGLCKPRITRVWEGMHPVGRDGVRHIGPFRDFKANVLVLSDEENLEFDPLYLGEEPIIDTFSVEHESPESQVLGVANRRVDRCKEPRQKKRLIRPDLTICASGLMKVKDHQQMGYRLRVSPEDLKNDRNIIVGEDTAERMAELVASARERQEAGRSLKDLFGTPESLKTTAALHEAILRLTGVTAE